MDTTEPIRFLFSLPRFAGEKDAAYKPGLGRMEALLDGMDRPHEAFEAVHVAGTNGKGSTASLIAAISTASGLSTGLHTSPHLFSVTERMRVDGMAAPEPWIAQAIHSYRSLFESVEPSFFEATVALSLLFLAERNVDRAVIEVGLGGRLDATNIVLPAVSVITHIGMDHSEILGDTLPQIAREKAGIIKEGVPVVTGVADREALEVIREEAARKNAPVHAVQEECEAALGEASLQGFTLDVDTPERQYANLDVGLAGEHQQVNALMAVRVAEQLGLSEQAIRTGLREVGRLSGVRGRLEVVHRDPLVVADVAHNAEALAVALDHIRPHVSGRLTVLMALMRDKALADVPALLRKAEAQVVPAKLDVERALPVRELARRLHREGVSVLQPQRVSEYVDRFIAEADPDDALLVTGSHYVVAELEEMQMRVG